VAGVLLVAVMVLGLIGCSQKKEASKAQVAGWFKAAAANEKAKGAASTTTTTPARVTTTIPATTSTMRPLVRLALSKAFLEAAEARRLAQQRCLQLRQNC
jgi:hypothetical protein